MLRLIAAVVAGAWAVSGWKNLPRLDHPSSIAAGLAIAGTCAVCFWCGAALTKAHATATATARAEARARARAESQSSSQAAAAVNVYMARPEAERAAMVPAAVVGLDRASWIGAPVAAAEQDVVAQMIEDGDVTEAEYLEA